MKRVALVLAVLVAGCQKSEKPAAPPPPPPTEALVTAMRDYCRIPTLVPPAKQHEALKLWGWQTAGNKDVGPIWTAAVKKNPQAIAMIRAAADAAVGVGNCNQLDALTMAAPR